jgi:membrane-associated phospholipid phosphatase
VTSRLRAPLLAALCCLLGFVLLLGVAYGSARAGRLDLTALGGLEALRGPTATPIAVWIAHLADPLQVIVTVLVLMAVGFECGRGRQAIAAAALVGVAVVSAEVLKVLLAHGRQGDGLMHQVNAVAFPSGHATAATAVALAAVLVSPPRFRIPVALAAAGYAVAVCMSVLVAGWHFPSDVFGGMLVASFYFCLAVAALRVSEPRAQLAELRPPGWWREGLVAIVVVAGVGAAARAGDLAAFASNHTAATATAIGVAVCGAAVVGAGGFLADR